MSGSPVSGSGGRSIEEIEALLDAVEPEDLERREPPADLWAAISAETANDDPAINGAAPAEEDDLVENTIAGAALEGKVAKDTRHLSPVPNVEPPRRGIRRTQVFGALVGAAAAAAVLFGISVANDSDPAAGQLASAQLSYDAETFDPLGADARATAVLVDDGGAFRIHVDDADLPATADDDDLELWLIEPDETGQPANLVSLGTFAADDDPGEFEIPDAFNPDVYYVVDISVEPRDGDPSHSGRSILRGALADL